MEQDNRKIAGLKKYGKVFWREEQLSLVVSALSRLCHLSSLSESSLTMDMPTSFVDWSADASKQPIKKSIPAVAAPYPRPVLATVNSNIGGLAAAPYAVGFVSKRGSNSFRFRFHV